MHSENDLALIEHLASSKPVYLVKIATSRTGKRRSYRAFRVNGEAIEDCTFSLCRIIGNVWNAELKTYDVKGCEESDRAWTEFELALALNINVHPFVVIL